MKIVNVSQMQKAERDCSNFGISLDQLMENAGKAVAEKIRSMSEDIKGENILILVGPGNNGGDGLVAARHLHDWGAQVRVYIGTKRPDTDPNLLKVSERNISLQYSVSDTNNNHLIEWLLEADVLLDSLFGTGKSREISGEYARMLNLVKESKKGNPDLKIIALDLPSGLNADSGEIDPHSPYADHTFTLGFPKAGLFNLPGAERAGRIHLVDIGIPPQLVDYINIDYLTDNWIKSILPGRPLVSNKGTYGKILALTGSTNYIGAAYLACTASIRTGAGLTTLATTRGLQSILAARMAEVTYLILPDSNQEPEPKGAVKVLEQNLTRYDVLLAGCGVGQNNSMIELFKRLFLESQINLPYVVLDADGINILAGFPDWWNIFKADAILTPHPGEMSRLLGKSVSEIQQNRIEITREAAVKWHKTVVLKGAYTVIGSPSGKIRVSPFANPGLASAGTGDVLAGTIAGLAAQGLSLFDAAAGGVYLHGQAAEMVKSDLGDAGMLASDLLPMLPRAIRHFKEV